MQVDFLYFEDCPSHDKALQRLKDVLAEEDVTAPVNVIQVETSEQAQSQRFIGSPTIRLNGEDIVPLPDDVHYELGCRVYHLPDGRFSPLPTAEMIRDAVRAHLQPQSD